MIKTDEMYAIVKVTEPEIVGFANVYEPGDVWQKVRGCDGCSPTCCPPGCKFLIDNKCVIHCHDHGTLKPFGCLVPPSPRGQDSNCRLVFEALAGSHVGKFRHKCDGKRLLRASPNGSAESRSG
jgi:hypothetical protein